MRFPRAGRFRDRVTVQQRVDGADDYGGVKDEWEDIADTAVSPNQSTFSRRCQIQPLNGREFFAAKAEHNSVNVRIRFRYSDSLLAVLKTGNRLVDRRRSPNRVFDIEAAIDHDNQHRELICMCVERS